MVEVIAEIGWNHMGDMDLAEEMIKSASESGASYAKFQTWSTKRLKSGEWDHDGRRQIYEKAELSVEDHKFLISKSKESEILKEGEKKQEFINEVDLQKQTITMNNNNQISFEIDPFRKKCLIEGLDDIALSLEKVERISSFEKNLKNQKPWIFND